MVEREYSACEIRKVLQTLFPNRRLVLSQLTFYNQIGVAKPNGTSFKRGRRCYQLFDILPIACIIGLKEEGIPLKNLGCIHQLLQDNLDKIFSPNYRVVVMGYGEVVNLNISGENFVANGGESQNAIFNFLADASQDPKLFWSYDVTSLANRLLEVIFEEEKAATVIAA